MKNQMLNIENVLFCWNTQTKIVGLKSYPCSEKEWQKSGYDSDVGASSKNWNIMSNQTKALALITEGIWLVRSRGFSPMLVFDTLAKIKEVNVFLQNDPF
jgi:hypothetical protein